MASELVKALTARIVENAAGDKELDNRIVENFFKGEDNKRIVSTVPMVQPLVKLLNEAAADQTTDDEVVQTYRAFLAAMRKNVT